MTDRYGEAGGAATRRDPVGTRSAMGDAWRLYVTGVLKTHDERFCQRAVPTGRRRGSSADDKPTREGYPGAGKRLFMMCQCTTQTGWLDDVDVDATRGRTARNAPAQIGVGIACAESTIGFLFDRPRSYVYTSRAYI